MLRSRTDFKNLPIATLSTKCGLIELYDSVNASWTLEGFGDNFYNFFFFPGEFDDV